MDRNMEDGVEDFQCQICLEVAYKPVVQACGHIFCFWCLHQAMDNWDTSHCPLCRSPYQHLPRVCELLHFLLLKAFPKEYKKRAEEILEWEKKRGTFSPKLDTLDLNDQKREVLEMDKEQHNFSSQLGTLYSNRQEGKVLELDEEKCNQSSQLGTLDSNGHANELLNSVKENVSLSPQPDILDLNAQASAEASISKRKLRVSDALCAHCKELIYCPTVLNCGHAFCESCVNFNIFQETTLKCQVCQSLHPEKSWAVCLELHHFLQNMFTVEYAEREKSMLVHNKKLKELPTVETAEASCQKDMVVHAGIGCDNCGLYPIMGKRYKCNDCSESVGFDLCETCYQSQAGSAIFGRFNQHHKAEHQFDEVAAEVPEGGDIFLDGDAEHRPGQRLYILTV